ncbi:MAG: tyrosine-type recombinase/integrase [Anaerolineales bacterium]|nr:tyrosine-type recombinase/integrase [Anaerolineales bacterium]
MEIKQTTPLKVKPQFRVSTPLAEWIESFLTARKAEAVSTRTLEYYRANLNNFLTWANSQFVKTVEEITPDHLRMYLLHLRESHNPGGVHGHFRAVRSFLNWFEREAEPEGWRNPIGKVKPPKNPDHPQPVVSIEGVERLFKAASGRMMGRDRCIILILADSGVRARELLGLDVADVDPFGGEVKIRRGKGGKSRTVFISSRTRRILRAWIRVRGEKSGPLFITDEKTRLTYGGLRQVLERLAERAGMDAPSIHSFRRFFAIESLRAGMDLLSLSRLMGHSDLSLLARYARQNVDDLRAAHEKAGPLGGGK